MPTTDNGTQSRHRLMMAMLIGLTVFLVTLMLAAFVMFATRPSGTTILGLGAAALAVGVIEELWSHRSDTLAVAAATPTEQDERHRDLGFKARAHAGRAVMAFVVTILVVTSFLPANFLVDAQVTPQVAVQVLGVGCMFTWVTARLVAARIYSKHG